MSPPPTVPSAPPAAPAAPPAGVEATWEALVAAALVGTARRRPPVVALPAHPATDEPGPPSGRPDRPEAAGAHRRPALDEPGPPSGPPGRPEAAGAHRRPALDGPGPPSGPPGQPEAAGLDRPSGHDPAEWVPGNGRRGGGDPAAELLAGAAVLSAYRRAGRVPGPAPARLPAAAEADGRPAAPDAAVDVLELILSGELPIPGGVALLAGQWLDGAARAGCRVPARLLPRLLELGSTAPALQPALKVVVGPRGRWLARQHDRWAWAAGEPVGDVDSAERRFPTAGKAERPAILEAVRRADPGRGLELLRSTWARDPAAERAALLAGLEVGLSDADEPFLEGALDDRSGAVRQVAANLLAHLPSSRRAARMAERLRSLLTVDGDHRQAAPGDDRQSRAGGNPFGRDPHGRSGSDPDSRAAEPDSPAGDDPQGRAGVENGRPRRGGGLRRRLRPARPGQLSFGRPPEPDAAVRRDGVNDSPPAGMGVSAWRLVQLVAGTPLSFWSETLGLTPVEVVDLIAGTDDPVVLGLEAAIVAQAGRADPDWAVALFAHRPGPALLAVLPADRAAGELVRLLEGGVAPGTAVAQLFDACPGPWPAELGEAIFDRYRQLGARAAVEVPAALPVLATRLDPAALPLVETWILTLAGDQALRRRVQTLGHALSLRAVIQREFP